MIVDRLGCSVCQGAKFFVQRWAGRPTLICCECGTASELPFSELSAPAKPVQPVDEEPQLDLGFGDGFEALKEEAKPDWHALNGLR